jgi:hypothetical protein
VTARDQIKAIENRYMVEMQKELLPHKTALELFEKQLTSELLKLGPDEGKRSIKTPVGTVYRERWDRYKVENRDTWIDWVFNTESVQMMTNHLSSEMIKEHMAEHNGQLPPGITSESGYNVKVRKS